MHIDVSGMVCPQPVSIVRRCLEELEPGDELVVTGDYPPAERSICRTCYKHGYAVTDATDDDSDGAETFTLRIRVTEGVTPSTGETRHRN
ncbi:sulfurtransferase TusA family protein [Natrinema halophilum]|uniref:sulfurtransferase TusA family protein n=1 Tax=Natrinema halophilum TaxID=1699371 RepID=UPI001F367E78|nr:sulfurtransferase TusA family protein [Natrinema halophilum]UHQ96173.1 sulfurtransferase TusA family protein [Natrinema halophilum]